MKKEVLITGLLFEGDYTPPSKEGSVMIRANPIGGYSQVYEEVCTKLKTFVQHTPSSDGTGCVMVDYTVFINNWIVMECSITCVSKQHYQLFKQWFKETFSSYKIEGVTLL